MGNFDIKAFLTKVELFEHFDDLEVDLVSALMQTREVKKNTLLFSENTE